MRIFGLETEYAVVPNGGDVNLGRIDRVAGLVVSSVEPPPRGTPSTRRFLHNGARLYLDVGGHPEYATPECSSARDVALWDRAGELLLVDGAASLEFATPMLIKNNVDSSGEISFGCHENLRTPREFSLPWLAERLSGHLASRMVFCGAGWVQPPGPTVSTFHLTQRARHIRSVVGTATTRERPMVNSRDEPLADPSQWRRLHVISGDSNMSPWATWLKIGTLDLILQLVERHQRVQLPQFADPVRAMRNFSADPSLSARARLADGRTLSALEAQEWLLARVDRYLAATLSEAERDVLDTWKSAIATLQSDPARLFGRVDWVTKLLLLDRLRERHGVGPGHATIRAADMRYHQLGSGLFAALSSRAEPVEGFDQDAVDHARGNPPADTRAAVRTRLAIAAHDADLPTRVEWNVVHVTDLAAAHMPEPDVTDVAAADELLALIAERTSVQ